MPEMKNHIVVCKSKDDVEPAKKLAKEQGGKIGKDYSIFPGFDVELPTDLMSTLDASPHIESIEVDGEVRTQ